MREFLKSLLHPYFFAGISAWAAVAFIAKQTPMDWAILLAWLAAFLASPLGEREPHIRVVTLWIQALCILALLWTGQYPATTPVLLVVFTAQLAMILPIRIAALIAFGLSLMHFIALKFRLDGNPVSLVLGYAGFQVFAMMTAHYARTAELATQQLAQVNADLLATRALLESTTRHGERLRVSRDLHDVVGHKLTALRLNLRALATTHSDPSLKLSENLTAEVLSDLRNVVSALRDTDGIDMETALRAMSRAFPRPRMQLSIAPQTMITDAARSEAILRISQEAMANAAKHGAAATIYIDLNSSRLCIEDDGTLSMPICEGNGLLGIRERAAVEGGHVTFAKSAHGGLHMVVSFT